MLRNLMAQTLKDRGISARGAAREIGVAHTTIFRILREEPIDFPTLEKVCKWLGVEVADILGARSEGDGSLAAKISIMVERVPTLAKVFRDTLEELEKGNLTEDDVQEIVRYANYRIGEKRRGKE